MANKHSGAGILLAATLVTGLAHADPETDSSDREPADLKDLSACYQSGPEASGDPQLTIRVLVSTKPDQQASGHGIVAFPPSEDRIRTAIKGDWDVKCQDSVCWVRYRFDSTTDPETLRGILKLPHWGHAGTVGYQIDERAMIEQKMIPVECIDEDPVS